MIDFHYLFCQKDFLFNTKGESLDQAFKFRLHFYEDPF